MTLNYEKLGKVAALMSSPADGEALSAARTADAMIRAAGLTWPEVLAGPGPATSSQASVPASVRGVISIRKDAKTAPGQDMIIIDVESSEPPRIYGDLIAFGHVAQWIKAAVATDPTYVFLVQLAKPQPGYRMHKVTSCVRL